MELIKQKYPKIFLKKFEILWHWNQTTNSKKIKLLTRKIVAAGGKKGSCSYWDWRTVHENKFVFG